MKTVRKLLVSLLSLALLMSVLVVPAFAEGEPSGVISSASLFGGAQIQIEATGVHYNSSIKFELYAQDELLVSAQLNEEMPNLDGNVSCPIFVNQALRDAEVWWRYTAWTPMEEKIPDSVKMILDGEVIATSAVTVDEAAWKALDDTLPPAHGNIESSVLFLNKDRISTDAKDIHYFDSVEFKLYSADGLMVIATLENSVNLDGADFITCPIYINQADREAEGAWDYTDWTPMDNVVPLYIELWLDGEKKNTEEVTVDAAAWAALEGTQAPVIEQEPQPEYPKYYPNYDENQPAAQEPAAQEPVVQPVVDEDVSPKTGEQSMYVALVALAAAAAVVLCARKAAMSR